MSDFSQTARRIVDDVLRHHPVFATWSGVHDYDHELDDVSADGFAQAQTRAKQHLATLAAFSSADLAPAERIDRELLAASFQVWLREFAEQRPHRRNPCTYTDVAIKGPYALLAHEYPPREERLACLRSRLAKIPDVLRYGQTNLERSPRLWTETAIEEAAGGVEFLRDVVGPLALADAELRSSLERAIDALDEYHRFLEERLLARDGTPFAIGRDLFDFKLERQHLLPYDAASLLAVGEASVQDTLARLIEVARSIQPDKTWVELVDTLRAEHPDPSGLLAAYRKGVEDARAFVRSRDLVTIPAGEELDVIETPVFLRPTVPYAAYQQPGPFEQRQQGLYYVTPVNERLPEAERREQMLGHNRYSMTLTNVHEAYPGHHLQLVHANKVDSPVRKIADSSVFCEGWALYCEQLVLDEGMTDDPRVRLFQLKDQLWRACRIVIDVKLHCFDMSFGEAVDMLVKVAHLERPNAIAEVRRYTMTPTQPMSYLVGKLQILDLREREKQRLGAAFGLRAFHDRLLSYGSIPVALVESGFAA